MSQGRGQAESLPPLVRLEAAALARTAGGGLPPFTTGLPLATGIRG